MKWNTNWRRLVRRTESNSGVQIAADRWKIPYWAPIRLRLTLTYHCLALKCRQNDLPHTFQNYHRASSPRKARASRMSPTDSHTGICHVDFLLHRNRAFPRTSVRAVRRRTRRLPVVSWLAKYAYLFGNRTATGGRGKRLLRRKSLSKWVRRTRQSVALSHFCSRKFNAATWPAVITDVLRWVHLELTSLQH